MIVVSYFLIRIQKGKGFSAYGLFQFGKYKFNLVKGLLLGFALSALTNLLTVWLNWNTISTNVSVTQILSQTLIFAIGTLFPSLAEDILTRGYFVCTFIKALEQKFICADFRTCVCTQSHLSLNTC